METMRASSAGDHSADLLPDPDSEGDSPTTSASMPTRAGEHA